MRPARALKFVALLALLITAGYLAGRYFKTSRTAATTGQRASTGREGAASPNTSASRPLSPGDLLSRIFDRLRSGNLQPGDLAALRRLLLAADPHEAMAAILSFLATGQDARTGESFGIQKGGGLAGAPTFRVMLLDLLGRIARDAGTDDAAAFSRALLTRKTSADEWAIALRNIAWSSPDARTFLAEKMREMLDYQPWRMQPSAGFLEAFDVIVFTRNAAFTSDLASMAGSEDDSLKRAAATAMDRLSEMAPLDVMNYLNGHPTEFADLPFLRADYYSKADLSQFQQRQAVEAYLSRPDVTVAEKEKLLSVFASPGSFVGDTLVTDSAAADDPPQRTAALSAAVGDWLQGNRFPDLANSLAQLQRRLTE
ncbi:MAG: hypothetical protein ABI318_22835 [Chthoniobacteraceae bacterium]